MENQEYQTRIKIYKTYFHIQLQIISNHLFILAINKPFNTLFHLSICVPNFEQVFLLPSLLPWFLLSFCTIETTIRSFTFRSVHLKLK